MTILYLLVFFANIVSIISYPDQGKWSFNVNQKTCHYFSTHGALYKNSTINVKITCDSNNHESSSTKINIGWVLRSSLCFEEYLGSEILQPEYLKWYYYCPSTLLGDFGYDSVKYLKTEEIELTCNHYIDLTPLHAKFVEEKVNSNSSQFCRPQDSSCDMSLSDPTFPSNYAPLNHPYIKDGFTISTPEDNVYLFLIFIRSQNLNNFFNATVDVSFKSPSGHYLSAVDYPLLNFYAIMSGVYLLYALIWFIVSIVQWKELFRIQFCIASVILLGMLEKAIFYGVYQSFNSYGYLNWNIYFLAEIISCFKRTLARVLFIIVSCGFEIIKPHLGATLNKIIAIGLLYFILSSTESVIRIYKPKNDPSNQSLMAGIPLALLDSIICWWIFSNLVQTTKILRLKRNFAKLDLFNYFTNVLIFAVLSSVCFMVWQIRARKLTSCLSDWKNIWFDEAYWHILFSLILIAIMILWRPTNNNQRYAFTPLLDASEEELNDKEDHLIIESGGDMKIRYQKGNSNTSDNNVDTNEIISKETVDNLKWIEENISTSLVDSSVPTFIDFDEDLADTRLQMSKIQ